MNILSFLDAGTIATFITAGLTIATSVFGVKYQKYAKLVKQIMDAIDDDQVTKEELKKIIKTIKNL
mgnify:CR=1 FL=1